MQKNSIMQKSIFTVIIMLLLTAMLMVIPQASNIGKFAQAYSSEIYYSDDAYSGNGGESTVATEVINYSSKISSPTTFINNSFPAYYNTNNSLVNACANVAGANIIGFYDRFYDNLIPDHTPGVDRGTSYSYFPMTVDTAKKQAVINDLYVRMATNAPVAGTSQDGYKSGITSYTNSKGYNASFSSVMTGSSLDLSKLQQALSSGKPVSLYLSGYNITQMQDVNNSVTLTKSLFTGNHIMIVYGLKTIDYYNSSNALIKSHTYLYVATGSTFKGYFLLNTYGTINDAESVNIS